MTAMGRERTGGFRPEADIKLACLYSYLFMRINELIHSGFEVRYVENEHIN